MTDRLKQIWSGFEQTTSRNLTGRGVENIPRPDLEEMERHRTLLESAHRAASVPMPEGVTEPAEAAFQALKAQMTGGDPKGRRSKARGDTSAASSLDAAGEDNGRPSTRLNAVGFDQTQLFRDLKETERLTTRATGNYDQWMAAKAEERASQKKRKKFLGIF